ncbi:MAG: DNA polymerase/3'-5' exonuclease PolX [Gemmatimonas sp.]|nr:DNA polymerase/3'-5' exonuclease PolX [Gemmatimonas sp.]
MSVTPAVAPSVGQVARLLAEIGTLIELNGRDSFRARAFANAARALEGTDADLLSLAREGRLTTLRGVGPAIAAVITDYVLTGRSEAYDELRAATPLGLYDLLRIPGLGPKRIFTLYSELGIDGLDPLETGIAEGAVESLPGFGARTTARIVEGIAFARSSRQLCRYPEALEIAARLHDWLSELEGVTGVEIVGAVRRRMEVVDRIELVAAAREPEHVLAAFRDLDGESPSGDAADDEAILALNDGTFAKLRCVAPQDFVAATIWETGSSAHVEALTARATERSWEFDRTGLTIDGERLRLARESELYERLGLAWVPPELREGLGEVDRAAEGGVPRLVELSDLRGTFHCHTTASDGKATLAEMAEAARGRGWSYLGIADHSRSAAYAGGLSIEEIREQHAAIDTLNDNVARGHGPPFRILKGIESDILPDGSLDYPDDILREFEFVVGSVHSSFGMPEEEMTRRIIRAVGHPSLTIVGHMTGRLLLTRDGYAIDVPAVLEAVAEADVIVEINANPNRLDLDWRDVRKAAELGILIAVNPDAHSVAAIDNVAFGVNMARKAGLEARQVINTWPLEELIDYLAQRKQKS